MNSRVWHTNWFMLKGNIFGYQVDVIVQNKVISFAFFYEPVDFLHVKILCIIVAQSFLWFQQSIKLFIKFLNGDFFINILTWLGVDNFIVKILSLLKRAILFFKGILIICILLALKEADGASHGILVFLSCISWRTLLSKIRSPSNFWVLALSTSCILETQTWLSISLRGCALQTYVPAWAVYFLLLLLRLRDCQEHVWPFLWRLLHFQISGFPRFLYLRCKGWEFHPWIQLQVSNCLNLVLWICSCCRLLFSQSQMNSMRDWSRCILFFVFHFSHFQIFSFLYRGSVCWRSINFVSETLAYLFGLPHTNRNIRSRWIKFSWILACCLCLVLWV